MACNNAFPVAVWHIHGTEDNTIPYDGNFAYNGAEYSQDEWADNNNCGLTSTIVYQNGRTTCRSRNAGCTGGAESVLCTVEGAPHSYDFPAYGIDSAETSWEFYSRFSRN
eukprot:c4415_g1_i1.p1 GENE.c4415_g1_i1~~c4415_g1_i1.p1  ORF type:complete len:110 (+),score=3.01 c4415_g1_i1:1-330(+)